MIPSWRATLTRKQIKAFVLHPGDRNCAAMEQNWGCALARCSLPDVLRDYGNLSSAVLFVLHEWLARGEAKAGT